MLWPKGGQNSTKSLPPIFSIMIQLYFQTLSKAATMFVNAYIYHYTSRIWPRGLVTIIITNFSHTKQHSKALFIDDENWTDSNNMHTNFRTYRGSKIKNQFFLVQFQILLSSKKSFFHTRIMWSNKTWAVGSCDNFRPSHIS